MNELMNNRKITPTVGPHMRIFWGRSAKGKGPSAFSPSNKRDIAPVQRRDGVVLTALTACFRFLNGDLLK